MAETPAEESKEYEIDTKLLEMAISLLIANMQLNKAINLAKESGYTRAEFLKVTEITAGRLKWFAEKQYDYIESLKEEEENE